MIKYLIIILLSIISGILYRLGGASKADAKEEFPYLPEWILNIPKKRDIGCAIVKLIAVLVYGVSGPWYIHLVAFLLLFGALTTYWDWLFGYDNYWFHGFMCGLAYSPYVFINGNWLGFLIHPIILALGMGILCILTGNDEVEEKGRGTILILPVLFNVI